MDKSRKNYAEHKKTGKKKKKGKKKPYDLLLYNLRSGK